MHHILDINLPGGKVPHVLWCWHVGLLSPKEEEEEEEVQLVTC